MQAYSTTSVRALILATLVFAANFSVWTLYAALTEPLQQSLGLSLTELGILLSAPMLTGALLRVPAGIWVQKYSAKSLLLWQMLLLIPPLLLLPQANTFEHYLLLGLWLGVAGSSFTLGIKYVADFFPSNQQGTALGLFGAGNAGAAINLILLPILDERWHWQLTGWLYTAGILLTCLLFWLLGPRQPLIPPATTRADNGFLPLLGQLRIWRLGLYYYFVFGSFLALLMWLPHYYVHAYDLSIKQAMAFTLLFVAGSSLVRSVGGWFADRYGGRVVSWSVFWICLVCLFFLSYPPTTMTIHGTSKDVTLHIGINIWWFTALLFVMGIAQGFGRASVYKLVNDYYPQQMGTAGGLIGAMGALGGCTLPILFGFLVDWTGFYSVTFMLLYGVSAACMIAMYLAIQTERLQQRWQYEREHNFLDQD
ncbi:MFS transporter [Lacimicrobium alkaliphilum]|uniref:MFS transporter n=1 Tax=Lacimicrobium alkaliphilum TaxID=1526571 RepID=A0A0U3B8N6_9ALTE|nr:MFS transporter [Lacimicrobium alkaliphilum]ALS98037.1 MFS transporter [Lacimicrobium alkaliphilum]